MLAVTASPGTTGTVSASSTGEADREYTAGSAGSAKAWSVVLTDDHERGVPASNR